MTLKTITAESTARVFRDRLARQAENRLFVLWGREYPNVCRREVQVHVRDTDVLADDPKPSPGYLCYFRECYQHINHGGVGVWIDAIYQYVSTCNTAEFSPDDTAITTQFLRMTHPEDLLKPVGWGNMLAVLFYSRMRHDLEIRHARWR